MSCCCEQWCTTRTYEPDGSENWQGPGLDSQGSSRQDIAVDSSGYAYTVSGGIEKLDTDGTRIWVTPNDGRFYYQGLRCICLSEDETHAYVGSRHVAPGSFGQGGFSGNNIFKVRLSDQVIVAEASITSTGTIDDCVADGSGGVYFATSEGVFHRDASFNALSNVGCNVRAEALAIDDEDNLYVVGEECLVTLDNGCDVEWSIRKYNSSGTLLDGHNFQSPSAVAWRADFLYVGFRDIDVASPCNVVKLDLEDWSCVWTFRVGESNGESPTLRPDIVRDIAVSDDGVYVVSNQYLFQLSDVDGTKNWCRKNEGTKDDEITKQAGQIRAVAANDDYVWITGQATPCNDAEEDACESGACESEACNCDCGESGRRGGTLVDCECDEVPCEFETAGTSDCGEFTISWTRDADIKTRWYGVLHSDCGSGGFEVNFDCEGSGFNGWSITASGVASNPVITQSFCTDDAPEGFSNPGFIGTFDLGGDCDCEEVCIAFGTDGAECPDTVDACGCEVPQTLTITINETNPFGVCQPVDGLTAELTYDGSGHWTFDGAICDSDWTFDLVCAGDEWQISFTSSCSFSYSDLPADSFSCSPFLIEFVPLVFVGGPCGCCPEEGGGPTSIKFTVSA